jgi:alpha-amylase
VGNFDWVFEDAFQKSYKPFIDTLKRYPSIAIVIHISGSLLEWLEENHPEYLDDLAKLIAERDIEILSAGFYEPILAVIPDHDKIGQIKKLNKYIKKRFNYNAKGIWLTERVWEPHLAKQISKAGINYIAVDDFHFLSAGKQIDDLDGYFTTDEQEARLGIFPISQKLRYAIPFQKPSATIDYLKSIVSEDGNRVIVMADDAEKFGVWPGTHENCFGENQWLNRFFQALDANSKWLKTTTFKKYFQSNRPKGRIYLPTVSYFEMSEWTLPADKGEQFSDLVHNFENTGKIDHNRQFLRGGMWRNFQNLYDESNWMQKRVTDLSFVFKKHKQKFVKKKKQQIQNNIWRAQCNCAYWHGVFGGLYLPHLRHGIYQNLIAADKQVSKILPPFTGTFDIDNDGFEEVDLLSNKLKIIASAKGGCIREFDIFSKNFNILNTMHQEAESYHRDIERATTKQITGASIHDQVIAKEANLEKYLHIDESPRYMLIDHFLPTRTTLKAMQSDIPEKGNFSELGFNISKKKNIVFTGFGTAFNIPIRIKKKLSLKSNILNIDIELTNQGNKNIFGLYSCELNFSLLSGHTEDRYYLINGKKPTKYHLDSSGIEQKVESINIVNEYDKFSVETKFDKLTRLWRHPIFTVSGSEAGLEKVYQSSVVIPNWKIDLKPNENKKIKFRIIVNEL